MKNDLDDIFGKCDLIEEAQPVIISKDEFISKAKNLLRTLYRVYDECWISPKRDWDDDSDYCPQCGGGGEIKKYGIKHIDCPLCEGTGEYRGNFFDDESFMEFFHEFVFDAGEETYDFIPLLHLEVG